MKRHEKEAIEISFNRDFKPPSIDTSKTYGFQITAFPPDKPKYESLKHCFSGDDLIFYEDTQGVYHLESKSSPIEAKVTLSPNLWEEQTKTCELTFTYIGLPYKFNPRKEIADFGKDISSRISWEHKIVWFTDDGPVTVWKASSNRKSTGS